MERWEGGRDKVAGCLERGKEGGKKFDRLHGGKEKGRKDKWQWKK